MFRRDVQLREIVVIALDVRPFGTQFDVYGVGYEWMAHSIAPTPVSDDHFRITIGGPECTQPYSASVFNISAMSFGALSANAIRALNGGARLGGFAHDTGEGGYSPYHREGGGDIIWEIGSGYFGARNPDGTFSPEKFAAGATNPQVKMVELKLSQGAKPGHGGVLPAPKVSPEISTTRGVPTFTHVAYMSRIDPESAAEAFIRLIGYAGATGAHMHICHFNSSSKTDIERCVALIAKAQAQGLPITVEAYPYGTGSTVLAAAFFSYPKFEERNGLGYDSVQRVTDGFRFSNREQLLAAQKEEPSTLVLFVSAFGGVMVMGAWGALLGPLSVRLLIEALVLARADDGGLPPERPRP